MEKRVSAKLDIPFMAKAAVLLLSLALLLSACIGTSFAWSSAAGKVNKLSHEAAERPPAPEPAHFEPLAEKAVVGDTPKEAARFSFMLAGIDGAPMPEGSAGNTKTATVLGAGKAAFGDIAYAKAGTYAYAIAELDTGAKGYAYDASVYTLIVEVAEQDGRLAVVSKELAKDGEAKGKALFTNRYTGEAPEPGGKPEPGTTPPGGKGPGAPKTGDESRLAGLLDMALVSALAILSLLVRRRRKRMRRR